MNAPVNQIIEKAGVTNHYHIVCRGPDGELKWVEEMDNDVVNEGLQDLMDKYLNGSAYTASWFLGLTDGTPTPAPGDTLATHGGWVEVTAYTGNRQAVTFGNGTGSGQLDNVGSENVFTIDTDAITIGGAFLATVATGTAGVLYSVAAFTGGDKTIGDQDTLTVTVTASVTSA